MDYHLFFFSIIAFFRFLSCNMTDFLESKTNHTFNLTITIDTETVFINSRLSSLNSVLGVT